MCCIISLFRSFFFFLILLQNTWFLQQILYGRRVSSRWNAHLCANHMPLHGSRHPFFKEAALGRPKVWYCRQSHFFQTCFLMLASFLASAFRGGQLAQSVTEPYKFTVMMPGHWIWGPLLGGVSLGAPCASCIVKTMVFAWFHWKSLKTHWFFILFGSGWPLGRHWGLGRPPGGLFWISLVASFVLEALWGPLWAHLSPFRSAISAFRHPTGSHFLNFKPNSDLA